MSTNIKNQKSILTAYLLWSLGLVYCCGIHRFYLGKLGSGVVYFCTLGACGVGQFIDLFLIPSIVGDCNRSQQRVINNTTIITPDDIISQAIISSQSKPNAEENIPTAVPSKSLTESLTGESLDLAILTKLRYAKQLTFSELWLDLKCDKLNLKERLQVLQHEDLIRIGNRESDGAVIYSYL